MELITKGVLVKGLTEIEIFSIQVTEENYRICRKKLEIEFQKIVKMFKIMKEEGEIKSTSKPKNKKLQKHLNKLVKAKRIIKQSINDISEMYYK